MNPKLDIDKTADLVARAMRSTGIIADVLIVPEDDNLYSVSIRPIYNKVQYVFSLMHGETERYVRSIARTERVMVPVWQVYVTITVPGGRWHPDEQDEKMLAESPNAAAAILEAWQASVDDIINECLRCEAEAEFYAAVHNQGEV